MTQERSPGRRRRRAGLSPWVLALVLAAAVMPPSPAPAQLAEVSPLAPVTSPRPMPRPAPPAADLPEAPPEAPTDAAAAATPAPGAPPEAAASATEPGRGPVTNLPLPRWVSLKGNAGNARRGPGLTHRIDWVFTHSGMPLRLTAEYENWRRVEDQDGLGGWVHYTLLSGVRTALVTADLAEFHSRPDARSDVVFKAEAGVIGRLLECEPDWCRLNIEGEKGWAPTLQLWGTEPGETVQ